MEPNPPADEIEAPRRRRRRKSRRYQHGRAWVVALWILLRIGDLPLLWLAFRKENPAPQIGTSTIVAIIWTTIIFIALWAKQIWARPVALLFIGYYVFSYCFAISTLIVSVSRRDLDVVPDRAAILLNAAVLYLGVLIALVLSKNIKYLIDPGAKWKEKQL